MLDNRRKEHEQPKKVHREVAQDLAVSIMQADLRTNEILGEYNLCTEYFTHHVSINQIEACLNQIEVELGEDVLRTAGSNFVEQVDIGNHDTITDATTSLNGYCMRFSEPTLNDYYYDAKSLYNRLKAVNVISQSPFPCGFDFAVVSSIAEKYGEPNTTVEKLPGNCRDENDPYCLYEITW